MIRPYNGVRASALRSVIWRKSSYSNPSGNCVELAELPAGGVAVRNSRFPDGPALVFTTAEWDAFVRGAGDGEFGVSDAADRAGDKREMSRSEDMPFRDRLALRIAQWP